MTVTNALAKPSTDNKFISLYKQVFLGQIPYYEALIKKEGIRPYSNYVPKISKSFKDYVFKKLDGGESLAIHVYYENGLFVMSDDYNLYYFYLELGIDEFPCFCMGDPVGKYVIRKKLIKNPQVPKVEIYQEK